MKRVVCSSLIIFSLYVFYCPTLMLAMEVIPTKEDLISQFNTLLEKHKESDLKLETKKEELAKQWSLLEY